MLQQVLINLDKFFNQKGQYFKINNLVKSMEKQDIVTDQKVIDFQLDLNALNTNNC